MRDETGHVKTVTVIGAGTMGHGIAEVSALGGFDTVLFDTVEAQLKKAVQRLTAEIDEGVKIGKVSRESRDAALARLRTAATLDDAAKGADLVIEAIPEDVTLKMRLFAELETLCPPHTVLASNTSGLSITEMASAVKRPQRVIGMHFFNPPHKMKLVEIIRGLETDDATFKAVEAAAQAMGKETVEVNESPGFVTSRINVLIGNEAFYMLEAGVASARDIDKAIKLGLNHPMGPFEMTDLVGLDVRLSVLNFLHERLGEKYRACPLLVKYVKAGRLGRKVGKGVYEYPEEK